MTNLKRCSKCKKKKDPTAFNKKADGHGGLRSYCRSCQLIASQKYYTANKDKIANNSKLWRSRNREHWNLLSRKWREQNPERYKAISKKWRNANKDLIRYSQKKYHAKPEVLLRSKIRAREYRKELAIEVFRIYGGKCSCCGESNWRFLTLDHIDNDGSRLRRKTGIINNQIYRMIRHNGKPLDGFTVLCANCNLGKQWNGGICPHSTSSDQ